MDELQHYDIAVTKSPNGYEALGFGYTKYLSSEVAGGFTGAMIGLYAIGNCEATFTDFECTYHGI